jgi:hypothetical protein
MSETGTKRKRTASKLATSETETTRTDVAQREDVGVSRDAIAQRAYEIAHGDGAGSDEQNWLRAEQELRADRDTSG